MAQYNFDACLKETLFEEGGFSNNPHDPGGMTNLGVTKAAWEEYVGHTVDEAAMRALNYDRVSPFYKIKYWNPLHCDQWPAGLDMCMFDFGMNAGLGHAAKILQKVVGATPDGLIGQGTTNKVNDYISAHGIKSLINTFQTERAEYYKQCHGFPEFGRGWLKRTGEITLIATSMVK